MGMPGQMGALGDRPIKIVMPCDACYLTEGGQDTDQILQRALVLPTLSLTTPCRQDLQKQRILHRLIGSHEVSYPSC